MKLMSLQEQQTQEQTNKGYFTMPDAPTKQEQEEAIDRAFTELSSK